MAFHPQGSYIPHAADLDPAYAPYHHPPQPQAPAPSQSFHPQQQQQQQHHQQGPYPHPPFPSPAQAHVQASPFNQPHAPPEGQVHRFHHGPQQLHVPNQAHGPPGSMPPPSIPGSASFHRQNEYNPHLQHQQQPPRAPDRWPLGVTDEQRQLQEQYRHQAQTPQILPNYNQPSPISSAPLAGPVSTFPPPPAQSRTPPQPQPPPQSPRVPQNPPSAPSKPQQPMTAAAPRPAPTATPPSATSSSNPPKTMAPPAVPAALESQRVSALLDLNRVLLQEVVTLQNAGKAGTPAQAHSQQQQQQTSPSPAADNGPSTDSTKDTSSTPKPPSQPSSQQAPGKVVASKEYIEYMRRLQANLAYLANVADKNHKPGNVVPQFPAIMEPPSHEGASSEKGKESLREIYARLKELWPEYKGRPAVPHSVSGTSAASMPTAAAVAVTASGP